MVVDLIADHDDLRKQMRDFAQLMSVNPPDREEIMRRRIAFSKAFRAHMISEDAASIPLRSRIGSAQNVAVEHGALVRSLFLRYSEHIKQWTPSQMGLEWTRYRAEVASLQNGLYDLMDWEEHNLFQHLDDHSRHAA